MTPVRPGELAEVPLGIELVPVERMMWHTEMGLLMFTQFELQESQGRGRKRCDYCASAVEGLRCASCGAPIRF